MRSQYVSTEVLLDAIKSVDCTLGKKGAFNSQKHNIVSLCAFLIIENRIFNSVKALQTDQLNLPQIYFCISFKVFLQ